jgi:hypothetical protein
MPGLRNMSQSMGGLLTELQVLEEPEDSCQGKQASLLNVGDEEKRLITSSLVRR